MCIYSSNKQKHLAVVEIYTGHDDKNSILYLIFSFVCRYTHREIIVVQSSLTFKGTCGFF